MLSWAVKKIKIEEVPTSLLYDAMAYSRVKFVQFYYSAQQTKKTFFKEGLFCLLGYFSPNPP